jgi:CDP-glucose 4,6-dehydratase
MVNYFNNVFENKRVFITGHTGFKGSWLNLWLKKLNAKTYGFSNDYPSEPCHHKIIDKQSQEFLGDIRDYKTLEEQLLEFNPDIIFHLAAQPIVRLSYDEPVETYQTNLMGSLNLYQASRKLKDLKAIVSITTDKVYENKEQLKGYVETDALGGYDPYSSSKACVEVMTQSFIRSFYNIDDYKSKHNVLVSTARAGNVIGGGDWGQYRLIPDIVNSICNNETLVIRNPKSTRPWQHVLDCLSGYLRLGQMLLEEKKEYAGNWNFGPLDDNRLNVAEIVSIAKEFWPEIKSDLYKGEKPHEAKLLSLDCSKSKKELLWKPTWDVDKTINKTLKWYYNYNKNKEVYSHSDLDDYLNDAKNNNASWINEV